jgi:hypothetical protein
MQMSQVLHRASLALQDRSVRMVPSKCLANAIRDLFVRLHQAVQIKYLVQEAHTIRHLVEHLLQQAASRAQRETTVPSVQALSSRVRKAFTAQML